MWDIYFVILPILCFITIIIAIYFAYKNKRINEKLLDLALMKNESKHLMYLNSYLYKNLLIELCITMKHIKCTDQDIGKLKKQLTLFFSDLNIYIKEIDTLDYKDQKSYLKVIDFIQNDLRSYLNNESDILTTDKIFKYIDNLENK